MICGLCSQPGEDVSFPVRLDRLRLTHLGEPGIQRGPELLSLGWNVGLPRRVCQPPGWVRISEGAPPQAPPCSPRVPTLRAPGTRRLQQPPADSLLPSWKGCYRIPGMCPKITSINT